MLPLYVNCESSSEKSQLVVVGQSPTIASIVEWSTDGLNHNSPKPSSGSTTPIDFL